MSETEEHLPETWTAKAPKGSGRLDLMGTFDNGELVELTIKANDEVPTITAAGIRRLPISRLIVLRNYGQPDPRTEIDPDDLRVGRPDRTLEWYEDFAAKYALAHRLVGNPAQTIADASGVPVRAVQRWAYQARTRGLLPKTGRRLGER